MIDGGHHPAIPPVADNAPRPKWSVLIPTYNSGAYLEGALKSVLAQDPGPELMEIIVVDDHSTSDDPEAVVLRVGGGRVRFIRQPRNVGKVRNYETGLLASRGELIHQLHGDDRVRPGFYRYLQESFDSFPQAGAFFCAQYPVHTVADVTQRIQAGRAHLSGCHLVQPRSENAVSPASVHAQPPEASGSMRAAGREPAEPS